MSTNDTQNSSESDNLCVVCFKDVEIYSIGCCDHAVCFECSIRMRILCKQNECPICRRDLSKVVLTKKVEPFSILFPRFERSNLQDRKFGIIFCTLEIQKAYFKLLEHRCHICEGTEHNWPFRTFHQLKDHMRREHELFYCDICSEHLKIFSFERRSYTRQELAHHRRKGDRNNTSHRGHPLCEFCDTRFMDSDELFRHLRRNHLFCHFCDADGKHQYYNSMDDLKRHFRDEHFLCEEGECKTMMLTAVFRTDIDLKAHITQEHGRHMSKSATKQARTLELEFTLAPRARNENMRNRRPYDRRERFEEDNSYNVEPGGMGGGPSNQPQVFVNPLTSDQFPALGGSVVATSTNLTLPSKNYTKFSNAAFNSNDFPSLGGSSGRPASAVTITANSSGSSAQEVTITRTVRNQQANQKVKENFPALGGSSKPGSSTVRLSVNSNNQQQPPKVSIHFNQKPNGAITTQITTSAPSTSTSQKPEVFPMLGKPRAVSQPRWVQPKPKKQEEPKSTKVAPCPVLETTDLNSFPSLSKGKSDKTKKTSSVTVPVDSWVNLNSIKSNPKFSKKSESGRGESSRGENSSDRIDGGNKGSGDNNAKKNDFNKKGVNKVANRPNKAPASASNLDARLDELKLIDVNGQNKSDDSKKSKKKKSKQTNELSSNTIQNDNKEDKVEDSTISTNSDTNALAKDVNENEEQSNKNGLIKKRSELKIGTLSSSVNVTSNSEDFPALGGTKPPPGFVPLQAQGSAKPPPPPGFNSTNFPALNASNDLTFTNSSGQSYAISPVSTQPYRQPQNFQNRNHNLIKKFMNVLSDNDTIMEFKTLSDKFRKGDMDAKKYHEHCRKVLGNKFDEVFPELLVLLPDIEKQQEIYKVLSGKSKDNLVVCENCKQVIFKGELSDHYNYHRLDNHFPSLGSAQQIGSAWKK